MHDLGGARIRVDRRGFWLLVDEGTTGVHVNGRPVRRTAMLRAGDSVHVADGAVLLAGPAVAPLPASRDADTEGESGRIVLRAIGGRHHGRGFALDQPREVGSDRDADIRLDPPVPARLARLAREQGRVVLRGIDGASSTVNGVEARDAELRPGDQVLFGGRDRFVLEVPSAAPAAAGDDDDFRAATDAGRAPSEPPPRRLPWLLLAALLIAAVLSAVLLL
jgi:pSer/pThr/pTyr-binding forkhead associated (FHA) protein